MENERVDLELAQRTIVEFYYYVISHTTRNGQSFGGGISPDML